MILIGSRAADLSGCLPTWRGGKMDDWDFYGDAADVERMRAYLAERCGAYEEATDRLGGVHFLDGKGLRISFLAWDAVADALTVAPDAFPAEALGQAVTAIGPYVQLALKLGYLRCAGFHAEKNERDVAYWLDALSPEGWTPAHDAVFRRMWIRAEEIFRTPPSDIKASAEMERLNRFFEMREL